MDLVKTLKLEIVALKSKLSNTEEVCICQFKTIETLKAEVERLKCENDKLKEENEKLLEYRDMYEGLCS